MSKTKVFCMMRDCRHNRHWHCARKKIGINCVIIDGMEAQVCNKYAPVNDAHGTLQDLARLLGKMSDGPS